jgi:hypothetical protein
MESAKAAAKPSRRRKGVEISLSLRAAARLAPPLAPTYIPHNCAASGQISLVCVFFEASIGDRNARGPASSSRGRASTR